ncbi:MAG TPA: hypothetical protein VF703_14455 [Pyrinomonadaceae bacterium]
MDELKIRVNTYQKYIIITLQVNAFYYAITGGVLGFYLSKSDGRLVFFLLLPILMGAVLGGIFLHGARLQKNASIKIQSIIDKLNSEPMELEIKPIDDVDLLRQLLIIFGVIFLLVSAALTGMPIIRELIKTCSLPNYLGVFLIFASLALIVGGCACLLVTKIFDRPSA